MIKKLKQQVIQAVCLEDVVQRYAELHRGSKSGKTLRCNCLFHRDESKSFKIKVTDQTYECSVCKETGDVVHLVQQLMGCGEIDALFILAEWFHIQIDKPERLIYKGRHSKSSSKQKEGLLVKNQREKVFNMILESLSFCQCSNPFFVYAHKSLELGVGPEALPDTYACLSGCMLFPVRNESGMLQGFLKYTSGGKKEEECLCVPESLADTELLGLYQAAGAIKRCGFAYLTWGSKDLLTMHVAGFTNTVACCSPALTYQQIELLLKYTNQVVIIYSGEIFKQVKTTKAIGRLSFLSVSSYRFPLHKGLSFLYNQMGLERFEYFVRQSTRLNYLNTMKDNLLSRLKSVTEQLDKVKSLEEKVQLRSDLIYMRNKLDKLADILNRNWEYLYWYFR
ncbi:CHC2 zinc finger domain-containing protein [uncultured Parabacteroides sp.]|uniref:CHC2 zinc finger domain-containing protein n=1 Tax=uncultured Parabacteroides sp. TaxID=512312 RepID=UPI0025FF20FD|nr:CHC2 zinc finger domain-containing protein [uncultured Parabacteroides sp.]